MSHFIVGVLTVSGTDEEVEKLLQPFHEFECTGIRDEFVVDTDITEEALSEYDTRTDSVYINPEGEVFDSWEKQFWRLPTIDEAKNKGFGTGWHNELFWNSEDWGDGTGYQARIHFLPEGWTEGKRPISEAQSFIEFVEDWYGYKVYDPENPGDSKYGRVEVNLVNPEIRVFQSTNPNKKWDWWVIGGRWSDEIKGNKCKVSCLPEQLNADRPNKFYAIVTPEGEWIAKGDMGWWGVSTNEQDDWIASEKEILAKYPDCVCVMVDCHIWEKKMTLTKLKETLGKDGEVFVMTEHTLSKSTEMIYVMIGQTSQFFDVAHMNNWDVEVPDCVWDWMEGK